MGGVKGGAWRMDVVSAAKWVGWRGGWLNRWCAHGAWMWSLQRCTFFTVLIAMAKLLVGDGSHFIRADQRARRDCRRTVNAVFRRAPFRTASRAMEPSRPRL